MVRHFRIFWGKDGGPKSRVWGLFLENKKLFTVALLKFENGSREAYHSHAFNAVSLILGPGKLRERHLDGDAEEHGQGKVVHTYKHTFHQVWSLGTTWALTLRGPWSDTWHELDEEAKYLTLTHGREVVR